MSDDDISRRPSGSHDPVTLLVPAVFILCVATFLFTAFQTYNLVRARQTLQTIHAEQEQPFADNIQLRQKVQTLASRTAQLAAQGNSAAQTIVDNLHRQGINIKPSENPPANKPAETKPADTKPPAH